MERITLFYVCGLIVGSSYLTSSYDTSLAFRHPFQSGIILLFLVGFCITFAEKYRLASPPPPIPSPAKPDDRFDKPLQSPRPRHFLGHGSRWRVRIAFAFLVLCLCQRVQVTRAWFKRVRCSSISVEPLAIIVLVLYDIWTYDLLTSGRVIAWRGAIDGRFDQRFLQKARKLFSDGGIAYALPTAAFCFLAVAIPAATSLPDSGVICFPKSKGNLSAFTLGAVGTLVDGLSLVCIAEVIGLDPASRPRGGGPRVLGWACLAASAVLASIATFVLVFESDEWVLATSAPYLVSLVKLAFVTALTCHCALHLALRVGLLAATMTGASASVLWSSWSYTWNWTPYLNSHNTLVSLSVLAFLIIAIVRALDAVWVSPDRTGTVTTGFDRRARLFLVGLGILLWLSHAFLSATQTFAAPYHPIDTLIVEAGKRHTKWEKENTWTGTLGMAVVNYRTRYGRHAPPNFDKWYQFATNRSSLIIDDYDNIFNDILPFWSLSPAELRLRAAEDIAQLDNGIEGIAIKDGRIEVMGDIDIDHIWMMKALVDMTEDFLQFLPDMELAINMNDESRTMIPYENKRGILAGAMQAFLKPMVRRPRNTFSRNQIYRWPQISNDSIDPYPVSKPFSPIFDTYGSAHCSPRSPARSSYPWKMTRVCQDCLAPHVHRLGSFPNDSFIRDVCHQPDLSYLSGFYASPSSFRGTYQLRPTFSQSKAPGFLDILYPSPWNYAGRVAYAPNDSFPDVSFQDKENSLFWRGASTEGFAPADGYGAWKGFTRQRFVSQANFPSTQNVLLPDIEEPKRKRNLTSATLASRPKERWNYHRLSTEQLQNYLPTNVSIIGPIARCMWFDCDDQINYFNRTVPSPQSPPSKSPRYPPTITTPELNSTTEPHNALFTQHVEFQTHWRYRYLFDLDGAGFSGRFLPFLQSHSLPFKTTSLFKEWWDGRITPWWHYVPIDPRLTGLYSTLAYFSGVDTSKATNEEVMKGEKWMKWKGRTEEAEKMAERGRVLAEKMLRREDMEVYLFRLLLEWGRVVDENREEIGFTL